MKRVLITGSTGFVGPYLAAELKEFGYVVFGLDRVGIANEFHYIANISDATAVASVVHTIRPQYIFHLAGVSNPRFAEEHPEFAREVNVKGTNNILQAAADLREPASTLIVSSSHVYGAPEYLPIDERHPLKGDSAYAESRREQEQLALTFHGKVPVIISRSFNHTGPGQPDTFVIPKIMKQIVEVKKGKREQLELGSIEIKRDISDVRDVVRAYRLLLEQDQFGLTVNVCRGASIALKEVIECGTVLAQLETVSIKQDETYFRSEEPADIYGSHALLDKYIDWKIEYSYERMLIDLYAYWDKQL